MGDPSWPRPAGRVVVPLLVIGLLVAVLPGTAAAASVQGVGSTVVIEEDETVDRVQAVAGAVVIRGAVTGDVEVAAGSLLITGDVGGDVAAAAGSVTIDGRVVGDVSVGAGSLAVGEDGAIGGTLQAGVGSARVAGLVGGDATIGGGSILLEPTATFEGDLRYDGELTDRGATVEGQRVHDRSIGGARFAPGPWVDDVVFGVYGFLVNLVLGVVLLLAVPAGSRRLARRVSADPLRMGLYGLLALVGVPVLLVLVALTIIGIPLAILGGLLFALAAWVGAVYGRYAIGEWLLGYVAVDNRWVALLVGLVVVGVIGTVPVVGGLVEFLVLLLGLGGLAAAGLDAYRRGGTAEAAGGS